ncbi:TrkH family potassium uptake protein [Rhabdothermincola sp.]|uniref:TrkH family potassium uptake protein n=1 Tax=Rhabdothermincola sp. TaxID=2820405 RepID=UPI002FE2E5A5
MRVLWRRSAEPANASHASLLHPARLVVLSYAAAALVGAVLLWLPFATVSGEAPPLADALFTAVSAISVTGLIVVEADGFWSPFGQVVILLLIQIGGFGITTMASLLGVVVFRRLGLRSRLSTQVELNEAGFGGIRHLIGRIAVFYAVVEGIGFVALSTAVWVTTGSSIGESLWFGLFHCVSAFNNAGFSTSNDNLIGFAGNPAVLLIVAALVVVGGIGFPVVLDVARRGASWRWWSLHTRLTLSATAVLLVAGAVAIGFFEWSNHDTLGAMSAPDRLVNTVFASVTPRTAGFNTVDYALVREPTSLVTQALMLIGGGSGSTAGGIKVSTFALLGFVIWSEVRGERDVAVFGRRVDERAQRQAVTIALLGVGLAMAGSVALASVGDLPAGAASFETLSALNTVGLSTGVTPQLPLGGKLVLTALMLLGRLGPVTVGTALVLRSRETLYRYPEGRPLLG